jgi:multiple sugar transport system substrate-binding protein
MYGTSILMMGGLVAGCGATSNNQTLTVSPSQTVKNSATKVGVVNYSKASGTIVWAASPITTGGVDMRTALVKQFEKEHPSIKVTLQSQPSDTDTNRASLTTSIGGGSATPDVYMGDVVWPAQFAGNQLAMPLNKVLPASFWSRFSGGLVAGATYKGQVYAAPFFADSGFLFYRKDLLKQAGLKPPTSWEQLQKDAELLQKKKLVQYGFVWQGASYEGLTCDFTEYLADAGGKVLDANGKASVDSPQATKALTFMRSLIKSGVSPTAVDTFQESQSENVFLDGKAAFLRNWTYAWNDTQTGANSKVVGKVGVAVLPTFGGSAGYSTIGGWDLYVNPHTKNVAASLAFIDWMTGKEAQTIMAKKFSEIPTNAAVANDPSVKATSPVFGVISKTHYISRPAASANYPAISKALYTNVNSALSGSTSVSAALKKAQQQIASIQSSSGGGL